MQNTMKQSLVEEGQMPPVTFSTTTNPELGLRQKVRAILAYKLKVRYRVAEIITLIDNGQTLPYDGIISRVA